jgi:hypothetical protein
VRKFSYKPRFYDPEKEERRKRYARYGKREDAQDEAYTPGKYIKGSLRDGNYSRTEEIVKNQKIIGVVTTILLFAVIFLISIISLILIGLVNVLQTKCMPWERVDDFEEHVRSKKAKETINY